MLISGFSDVQIIPWPLAPSPQEQKFKVAFMVNVADVLFH